MAAGQKQFLEALATAPGHIVLVSNEVGHGIVPLGSLSRQFVDESGRLHQDLAAMADRVVLVTAGLEQVLKPQ
jgi:adenosylcobinamide kinase/adenosylcobinamide-phosphate guanylyltransferase